MGLHCSKGCIEGGENDLNYSNGVCDETIALVAWR